MQRYRYRWEHVYRVITDTANLEKTVAEATAHDRYAIDTEFHRERTYFPQLALVQLAFAERVELIDPLKVNLQPLAELLQSDSLCVIHAGGQDLEMLELSCGTTPKHLFDTQIAAGFLGISTGSLNSLLKQFLDIDIPKGDRLTDWLRRPLSSDQLKYAASDVEHLLNLAEILEHKLTSLNRLDWVSNECELLLERPRSRRVPEEAIMKIKEARSLKGSSYNVASVLAAWRERRAATANVPARQVLSDLGVVAIAQQKPAGLDELRNLRGVENRHLRDGADSEILTAVQAGLHAIGETPTPVKSKELPKHLRPVITLIMAWVSQIARDNRLDPALLATRSDVESLLKGDTTCRLLTGWRQDLVGAPIALLVNGEAAVAFDGDGKLVLEARTGQILLPSATS